VGAIFISHASADVGLTARVAEALRLAGHGVFMDSDREDGIAPGHAWQQEIFRELRSCDAVVFLNSEAAQASQWCHSELVMAEYLGKPVYSLDLNPTVPLHPLLKALEGITYYTSLDAGIRRLAGSLEQDGLAEGSGRRWDRGRAPYPGLAEMDVADARVFFGRKEEVRKLMDQVTGPLGQHGHLVSVIGPSGAGKSSLVRAGLAAKLTGSRSGWAVASPFKPGMNQPLDRLASALADLLPADRLTEDECLDRLRRQGLADFGGWLVRQVRPRATRLLITVDQAEELVIPANQAGQPAGSPPTQRAEFLRVLETGLRVDSPVTIVMTFPSDRVEDIQRLPLIGANINDPLVIAPVHRSQLEQVIARPAEIAGLTVEPSLVSRLATETMRGDDGDVAHALPLLAFVLREMYERVASDHRSVIVADDYEQVGELGGAIDRRAEVAERLLSAADRECLDHMLTRFVSLTEDSPPVARPVPRAELTAQEQGIARALESQRLLVGTGDGAGDSGDTVRLAHERLISAWSRLATVVSSRRDDLLRQERLARQARDWTRGVGALLGGDAARDARSWLNQAADASRDNPAVRTYIQKSWAAVRRRQMTWTTVIVVIAVLALTASGFAVVSGVQRANAQSEAKTAQSEAMAAEATGLLSTDAPLGMLLSLQAYQHSQTLQATSAVIDAAQQPLDDLLTGAAAQSLVAFGSGGQAEAVDGEGQGVGLWNVATRHKITLPERKHVDVAAFSPDGQTLAIGDAGDEEGNNGTVHLWDVNSRKETVTLNAQSEVGSLAFSPDRHTLAVGDDAGMDMWHVTAGKATKIFSLDPGDLVVLAAFSPDGHTLATVPLGESNDVDLWNASTGQPTGTLHEHTYVDSMAFSPVGHTLAVGNDIGNVSLWDTATQKETATLDDGFPVTSLAFSRDGHTVAVGDGVGDVTLWDSASRQEVGALRDGSPIVSLAFSPDGTTLATSDQTGRVGTWEVAVARRAGLTTGDTLNDVALSPDGRTLATGNENGDITVWDAATAQKTVVQQVGTPVTSTVFSPDGRIVAAGDTNGDVVLRYVATNTTRTFNSDSTVTGLAFSPDGRTLAVGDPVSDVTLWNVATRKQEGRPLDDGSPIISVAFSPDGHTLATSDEGGDVIVWNTDTGKKTVLRRGTEADSLAFSPDGRTLATGDDTGDIDLWNTATEQKNSTLHDGSAVTSVAFSPQGGDLVTGDGLGNVNVWSAGNDALLASLTEADGGVSGLAFSKSGQVLAVGDADGKVALLQPDLGNLNVQHFTSVICAKVRTNLTQSQWDVYATGQAYQQTCR
jgi:WD40 repeat protein